MPTAAAATFFGVTRSVELFHATRALTNVRLLFRILHFFFFCVLLIPLGLGIPYHMSGGSVDDHVCFGDDDESLWLPLYANATIVEQPVTVETLAERYAETAKAFIKRNEEKGTPYFLYLAFSHVHQLCAPKHGSEQQQCQWGKKRNKTTNENGNIASKDNGDYGDAVDSHVTFTDAVEEMDWIAGQVLHAIDMDNTIVWFTSDNGPWVAEQECAGSKGPFEGRWLVENTDPDCTSCPSSYKPSPTDTEPRRCVLGDTRMTVTGVPCGADTGLGSVWEANIRMPALVQWPGKIQPGTESMEMVSSLDIVPTILSIVQGAQPLQVDGIDISPLLFGQPFSTSDRALFFWRDGFEDGPLPPPYGRNDVAAAKLGRYKAFFSTKSAHYNDDKEQFHDPPLLFDVLADPAEAFPLDPTDEKNSAILKEIQRLVHEHKASIPPTFPYTLPTDPRFLPCVDPNNHCRTSGTVYNKERQQQQVTVQ